MGTRSLAQIEQEIAETKAALKDVHGTETEVYARIVGYYRAVKHWNKGKRDEFDQRKMFTLEASKEYDITEADGPCECSAPAKLSKIETKEVTDLESVSYEMYTRKTCPNCPPVKDFMADLDMPGRAIDVDTKEGLAEAAKKGIFASPTVIFFNKEGIETARCHNVEELEAVFNKVAVRA
ncbi:MAG: anaerobic ribonucleoside-triphosphate reductase [Spirochaetales bacterium]|nr:anaerobic ribonucleoside-triphosphate reductase [Spirochaetales bacterium]